jgi:hypothetical protein
MALIPFTGVIREVDLRINFDDKTETLTTNALAGKSDHVVTVVRYALNTTDDISLRCVDFTPVDDYEVRVLRLTLDDSTASRTVTATVTVTDGDTTFLLDKTVSVSGTTVVGVAHANLDLRTVTGDRLRLLKGVPYRLTINQPSAGPVTRAQASLVLRSLRRTG